MGLMPSPRPIFIVGSPRSGTSILTWCLGQHSNILVQEESSWIGPFACQIEIAYRKGTARGERSQLSALGVAREDFFEAFGRSIDKLILDHRANAEANAQATGKAMASDPRAANAVSNRFQIARSEADPKARWVDGTPEYSFYINPLRKLFPKARFIHIVRDVGAVVRSMLHFERTGGPVLVGSADEAYDYWLRTVRACLQAEHAYGSRVVRRVAHTDLVAHPRQTIAALLDFLAEDFEASCVEPLQKRINSSEVPADFDGVESQANPEIVAAARELTDELAQCPTQHVPDPDVAAELENSFRRTVNHYADLNPANRRLREQVAQLQRQIASLEAQTLDAGANMPD
jgi:Sulfotransferase family